MLDRLAKVTADAGTWLVVDETYEDFLFSGQTHYCPNAPHIVHVFSFSKVSLRHEMQSLLISNRIAKLQPCC